MNASTSSIYFSPDSINRRQVKNKQNIALPGENDANQASFNLSGLTIYGEYKDTWFKVQ